MDKINELFDYVLVAKKQHNSRLEKEAIKQISQLLNLNFNKNTLLFFTHNFEKFPQSIIYRVEQVLRTFEEGREFLKTNQSQKQNNKYEKLIKDYENRQQKFITILKNFDCEVLIENDCFVIKKNNKILRESLDILNYCNPKELLIERGVINAS